MEVPNAVVQASSLEPSWKGLASSTPGMLSFGREGAWLALPLPPCQRPLAPISSSGLLLPFGLLLAPSVDLPVRWSCCLEPLPSSPGPSPIRFFTDLQGLA